MGKGRDKAGRQLVKQPAGKDWLRAGSWLVLVASVAGCRTPSLEDRAEPPVAVPAEWASESAAEAMAPEVWWETFGEPGLNQAVERALSANHDLAAAAARVEMAAAQARVAGASLWPQAGLDMGASRRQQAFVGLPFPGGGDRVLKSRSTSYGLGLNLSWEADLWGRLRAQRKAAVAEGQAASAEWEGARLSLAGRVAKVWFGLAEAEQQVALAENTANTYEATVDQVQSRYERGIRGPLDLRLALGNAARARAMVDRRREQIEILKRQLETLQAEYPAGREEGSRELPEVALGIPAGIPSEVLRRRPDLVVAERQLAAAEQSLYQSKAALLPRLSLTGSGGTTSNELEDLISREFSIWTIAGNLAQPIFEGGRLRAGVDLSEARVRQALEEYASAALTAFREVESALAVEGMLARQEAHLEEAAEEVRGGLVLAEERYASGLADFITVLETQRRVFETESELITVRRQRLDNRIDLYLALGGGFPAVEEQKVSWPEAAKEEGLGEKR